MRKWGHFLAHLPSTRPFVFLGVGWARAGRGLFTWDFCETTPSETPFSEWSFPSSWGIGNDQKASGSYKWPLKLALMSYNDGTAFFKQIEDIQPDASSRVLSLTAALSLDEGGNFIWLGEPSGRSRVDLERYAGQFGPSFQPTKTQGREKDSESNEEECFGELLSPKALPRCQLSELQPDSAYLSAVRHVLEDIKWGRYYQLNLLRYFNLAQLNWPSSHDHFGPEINPQNSPPDTISPVMMQSWWPDFIQRFITFSEDMSAMIALPDLWVASFSPERFVRIYSEGLLKSSLWIETLPIKGTAPRSSDTRTDRESRECLENSVKDRAELNMITDLMRHDLTRISHLGTTEVLSAGTMRSLASVHHRQACIRARLRSSATGLEIAQALLPAGSITGAPKMAVMKAISELEDYPRGYMMGTLWLFGVSGRVESSVLIRTLTLRPGEVARYGAGSGLVSLSDPEEELREIQAKCRMWGSVSFEEAQKRMVGLS